MKKFILFLVFALPIFGYSQLWNFNSDNGNWIKSGSGQFSVDTYGATLSGNLYLKITGNNVATNNYLAINNITQNIANPTNYKFLRIKLINYTPVTKVTFSSDTFTSPAPTGITKYADLIANSTSVQEVFIDISTIAWCPSNPGGANTYELKFQKAAADNWQTTQYIAIDEIEFMTDIIKNDHLFNTLDNWQGETSMSNNSTVAISNPVGKLIVTPLGGINAKALNSYYSVDAGSNKIVHVIYKNNSANNNTLRVNYFSPADTYAVIKSLPDQTIGTNGTMGEAIFDATAEGNWTGTVRKLAVIITNTTAGVLTPTSVDPGTFEIDRIVINNSTASLAVNNVAKAKNLLQVIATSTELNFRNVSVTKATVYNMNGQVVKEVQVNNNVVDISALKDGVYLVRAIAQDQSETITKFIKN